MIELHETYSSLDESAGKQAILCEVSAVSILIEAVEFEGVFGFTLEVGELRDGRLHLKCQFILRDPSPNLGIVIAFKCQRVQLAQRVDHVFAFARRYAIWFSR